MEGLINNLANYGVLGLWTLTLLYEKIKYTKKRDEVIENNTRALTTFAEIIRKCQR